MRSFQLPFVISLLTVLGLGFTNCTPVTKFQSQQNSRLESGVNSSFLTLPINIAIPPAQNGESFSGKIYGQASDKVCSDGSIYRALIQANMSLTQFMLLRYDCANLNSPMLLLPESVQVGTAGGLIFRDEVYNEAHPNELPKDLPGSAPRVGSDPAAGEPPPAGPTPTLPPANLYSLICLIKFVNSPADQGFSLSLAYENECRESFNLHVQLNPGKGLAVYVVGVGDFAPSGVQFSDINAFLVEMGFSAPELVQRILGGYQPTLSAN